MRSVPYAWLQLSHDKLKLLAAIGGVMFAVMLVFMQLGLREALFDSSVRLHRGMDYDLVMLSPRTTYVGRTRAFPRSRLFQLSGVEGIASVSPMYTQLASYYYEGTPDTHRQVLLIGIDPNDDNIRLPGVPERLAELRSPDLVVMDQHSREEFAPLIERFRDAGRASLLLNDRTVSLIGLYSLGASFGVDGSVITSDLNFRRIFPDRSAGRIDLGLIRLRQGVDAQRLLERVAGFLPDDVLLLTRADFVQREVDYWSGSTPIGYVFSLGAVIGIIVGLIVVYQILFADVQTHLGEYATLKAMGYSQGYLRGLIFREAIFLSVLAFVPALGLSILLYEQAAAATQLPLVMTVQRALLVLVTTTAMCCLSGLLAIRQLKGLDPAEVF